MAKRSKSPADETNQANGPEGAQADPAAEAPVVAEGNGQAAAKEQPARGRQTAAPICPYHKKPTKAGHSNPFFTYYYCQVPHCAFSVKQARPNLPRRLHEAHEQQDHSAR